MGGTGMRWAPAMVAVGASLCIEAAAVAWMPAGERQGSDAGDAVAAITLCTEADQASDGAREALLARGLELAERAVAADAHDATAHYAVFCNLGKQVHARAGALLHLGRLKRELDTALRLRPDYPDALAAKGAMLVSLPWFFGGDVRVGEELLCAALARDPGNADVRHYLAQARGGEGDCGTVVAGP